MKIQKQIDVRLMKKVQTSSLRVVQFDTCVQLVFNILDFEFPDGTTATYYARKKSGKFVYQETGIMLNANTVTVDLENQALTEHGEVHYQLRFLNNSDIVSTFYGIMFVDPSLADADAEESKTVVSSFNTLTMEKIAEIEAATDAFIAQAQAKVADKGVEVLASIPADYTETSRMADRASRTKADAIICSAEGDLVAVADASDNPLRGLKLFGKTTQKTTTGKNLFHNTATTKTVNGVTFTINDDGSVSASGTASANIYFELGLFTLPAGDYLFSGCTDGSESKYLLYFQKPADSSGYVQITNESKAFTISDSDERKMLIAVYTGTYLNNKMFYPMIRKATETDATYERYTGGVTAPNPDYPMDFESVGDSGSITAKIAGKNLVNMDDIRQISYETITKDGNAVTIAPTSAMYGIFVLGGADLIPGHTYTASCELVGEHGVQHGWRIRYADGDYSLVSNALTYTFTPTKPVEWLNFYVGFNIQTTENVVISNIQVEIGEEATEFEQHTSDLFELTTENGIPGIPVSSGGNYTDANGQQWVCDEVDLERGVYVKRIGERMLDGSEDEYWFAQSTRYYTAIADKRSNREEVTNALLCSHFRTKYALSDTLGYVSETYYSAGNINILFNYDNGAGGVDNFVTWLQSNPVTVRYLLANPVEITLTAAEIEAFKAIHSNYLNTTVLNDAGAWMEVKYNADTKTFVTNLLDGGSAGSAATIGEVTLLAANWKGTESPYSQVVQIKGVTENSQVDLTPSIEQLAIFHNKDLAFVTENEGGVVTVYALGDKPLNDYTIQVTITEVYT